MSREGINKEGDPHPPKGTRAARRTGYPESENLLLRSSSLGHRQLKRWRHGLESSGFHPQMACGHLVHQYERCKSAESRINLLHGTSPRYCDVDETRDWSRLSKSKMINFQLGDDIIGASTRARKRRRLGEMLSPAMHISHISTEGE
jgi:hypothetical protein